MKRPLFNILLLAAMTVSMIGCVLPSIPKPYYRIEADLVWSNGTETPLVYFRTTTIGLAGPGMHAYLAERSKTRTYFRQLDVSSLKEGDTITLDDGNPVEGLLYMDHEFKVTGAPPGDAYLYTRVTFNTGGASSTVACTPRTEAAPLRVEDSLIYCGYSVRAGGTAEPAPPALLKHRGEAALYQDGVIYFYTGPRQYDKTISGPVQFARVNSRSWQEMGTVTLPMQLDGYALQPQHFTHSFLFVHAGDPVLTFAACTISACRSFRLKRDYPWGSLPFLSTDSLGFPFVISQTGDELVVLKDLDEFDDHQHFRVVRIKADAPARAW